jgi:hypothetical protein
MGKSYKERPDDRFTRERKTPVYDRKSRRETDREVRKKLNKYAELGGRYVNGFDEEDY